MSSQPSVVAATGLTGLVGRHLTTVAGPAIRWASFGAYEDGQDVTRRDEVRTWLAGCSAPTVLHVAAFTNVTAAWRQSGDKDGSCYQMNVIGTRHVAEACADMGKYLIHVSTDYVFGGEKDGEYTEADQPDAIDWYGQTKQWAEEEVHNSGCEAAIVRLAYPFGRYPFEAKRDLVWKVADNLRRGVVCSLFADTVITPTLVDDFAAVLLTLVRLRRTGVFHAVGSTALSPYDLGRAVAAVLGLGEDLVQASSYADYVRSPDARPYPRRLAVSNRRVREELGVSMRTLEDALNSLDPEALASHRHPLTP